MVFLRQIFHIAFYEVTHIFRDKILFLIVFVIPLAYTLLFGSVYVAGVLLDIPLGIVDCDHSRLSREIVKNFKNSSYFKVVSGFNDYQKLEKGMATGVIRAGLVIPENYEEKITLHQNPKVLFVYDGSNLIWGYNARKYAREIINEEIGMHAAAYLAGLGLKKNEIKDVLNTVSCNIEVWYNPTFNYNNFLFMGLVLMVLHQLGLMSTSLAVAREKERNSWIQFMGVSVPGWKIFLGKAVPYFISNFFNYGLLLWFSDHYLQVKIAGSISGVILLGLLYALVITSIGYCISLFASNSLQATRYLLLISVPFFIISGYTWPATHMPGLLSSAARFLPYTWMAEGFRLLTVKELEIQDIKITFLVMFVMAFISVFIAVCFTKRKNAFLSGKGLDVNRGVVYPRKDLSV